jgi:OmpA-OmpF porin, OOP family
MIAVTRILTVLLFATALHAQPTSRSNFWEIGAAFGASNYSGDVAEKVLEPRATGWHVAVFSRYQLSHHLAVRLQAGWYGIRGSDANARTPALQDRSLRFSTTLASCMLMPEWNFMGIKPENRADVQVFKVIPYLYAGIGMVWMRPDLIYFGPPAAFSQRVLYPIPEVEQEYHSWVVPFGFCWRAQYNRRWSVGLDTGFRFAQSDYLDGVKYNGKANHDWFYTLSATVAYAL